MLNIVKKVLFYALIAVSILSVINIIILCQFHTQIPLGLYTISALLFVACTFNIYLFIPLCLVICILILLSATSFLREKILLPLFSLVYLSIDLALLFFNFFNAWIIDGFFIAQQAIQLAINAIIFMFLLVYFALIGQKRRSEGNMSYITNGKIFLINTNTTNAHAVISGFSTRYHNYHSNSWPGIWECRLIKSSNRDIQLQLIDRIYEPPRGIKTSESPIIHITLARHGDNVVLTFCLRQQFHISIIFLLYLAFTLIMLFFSLLIFSKQYYFAGIIPFFCSLILISIALVWSIRNYNHNPKIILVFNEILRKNFDCSSVE